MSDDDADNNLRDNDANNSIRDNAADNNIGDNAADNNISDNVNDADIQHQTMTPTTSVTTTPTTTMTPITTTPPITHESNTVVASNSQYWPCVKVLRNTSMRGSVRPYVRYAYLFLAMSKCFEAPSCQYTHFL